MIWKYYVINEFSDNKRLDWAELFVMPADPPYTGETLLFTIDCIGKYPRHSGEDEVKFHQQARKLLGDSDYYVCGEDEMDDSDLIVNAKDFSEDELLEYVKILIGEKHLPFTELISAPIDDFKGRKDHADVINEIIKNNSNEEKHIDI